MADNYGGSESEQAESEKERVATPPGKSLQGADLPLTVSPSKVRILKVPMYSLPFERHLLASCQHQTLIYGALISPQESHLKNLSSSNQTSKI